jgi:hypothetical protein
MNSGTMDDELRRHDTPQHKLCPRCGQPIKPKGVKKLPNEYDHARGCPYSRPRTRGQQSR